MLYLIVKIQWNQKKKNWVRIVVRTSSGGNRVESVSPERPIKTLSVVLREKNQYVKVEKDSNFAVLQWCAEYPACNRISAPTATHTFPRSMIFTTNYLSTNFQVESCNISTYYFKTRRTPRRKKLWNIDSLRSWWSTSFVFMFRHINKPRSKTKTQRAHDICIYSYY